MVVSSFASSSSSSISPRPSQLKTYIVLSANKYKNSTRLRRHSSVSSCVSTEDEDFDCDCDSDDDACSLVDVSMDDAYESYAAVATRNTSPRELRWSDLNRPRLHLSSLLASSKATSRPRGRQTKRHLKRCSSSASNASTATEAYESHVLELCFDFLTLEELQTVTLVSRDFRDVVITSQRLLTGLYCRQWGREIPLPRAYLTLPYQDQLTLCLAQKPATAALEAYLLSTRSTVTPQKNGTFEIVNDSMLRSFATGAIDSVRGTQPLPVLSCAQAIHRQVVYYEVVVRGSGSVGMVALADTETCAAYGFGSAEHLGWKGVSYGYHSNDGDFVFNDGTAAYGGDWKPFGPSWGSTEAVEGDRPVTIGCGVDLATHEMFFTLNGEFVGVAPAAVAAIGGYTAAVSLHSYGDSALLNMGTAPFLFDIEGFCASP